MNSLTTDRPLTCITCEFEIAGPPEFHAGLPFCCAGCVVGGPCLCSYDLFEDVLNVVEAADTAPVALSIAGLAPRPERVSAGMRETALAGMPSD